MTRIKIFFDGGCRPNPGWMEIAVVAAGRVHVMRDLGRGTSAEAEWLALIQALRIARNLGRPFVLMGDSRSIVDQANGAVKPRGTSGRHFATFIALAGADTLPRMRHIKRSQNLAGIALARLHPR